MSLDRALAQKIAVIAQCNRRLVPLDVLRHFCGVFFAAVTLWITLARLYIPSIYFDMARAERDGHDIVASQG